MSPDGSRAGDRLIYPNHLMLSSLGVVPLLLQAYPSGRCARSDKKTPRNFYPSFDDSVLTYVGNASSEFRERFRRVEGLTDERLSSVSVGNIDCSTCTSSRKYFIICIHLLEIYNLLRKESPGHCYISEDLHTKRCKYFSTITEL